MALPRFGTVPRARAGAICASVIATLAIATGCTATAPRTDTASVPPESSSPTASAGGGGIVMIGDSIMSGYGLEPNEPAWPVLLSESASVRVTNLACPGAGFIAIGDCNEDYAGLAAQAVALDPAVVIIQSSDNDFGSDADDLDQQTLDTVRLLHVALPHARIVGLSTIRYDVASSEDEIAQTSQALKSALEAVDQDFIDIGQPLEGDGSLMQGDDEHPTEQGQQVLASAIERVLAQAGVIDQAAGDSSDPHPAGA